MRLPSPPSGYTFALVGVFACGLVFGRASAWERREPPTITLQPDTRATVPVVEIDDVRGQVLRGRVRGEARVFAGFDPIVTDPQGEFRVPFASIVPVERVTAPAGMQFVAARGGKLFYTIDDTRAQRLAPATRVYFHTVDEALAQGYTAAP